MVGVLQAGDSRTGSGDEQQGADWNQQGTIRFGRLFLLPVPTRPSPGEGARGCCSVGTVSGAAAQHLPQPISWCPVTATGAGSSPAPSSVPLAAGSGSRPGSRMSGAEALGPPGLEPCTGDIPSLKELEQLLSTGRPSCNHVDEVWPNLFLGDLVTAHNRFILWKMGVTHVLNAAHGTAYSHGGQDYYGATIDYYGVPAHDLPSFDISQFFYSAAEFIHKALNTPGEKLSLRQTECVQERSKMPHTRDDSSPTSSAGSPDSYETPALADLQRLIWFRGGSDNHVDQVWPNIYLGDAWAARCKTTLQSLNITHILNAADGPYSINTGARYYKDLQIEYFGVEAFDDPSFDLSIFFYDAANFIGKALNTSGVKFIQEVLWKMLLKRKVGSKLRLRTAT
eukprot:XP_027315579.1 uncharacterized protein LOC101791401 isoform X3 [Anas platyrhynchos]